MPRHVQSLTCIRKEIVYGDLTLLRMHVNQSAANEASQSGEHDTTYIPLACCAPLDLLNFSNPSPPTGNSASYFSISCSSPLLSSLSLHCRANSSGVRGTRASQPSCAMRSEGLVREVRKSAVVCRGGQYHPREVKNSRALLAGPK